MNGFGAFVVGRPDPPEWKSAWRREFERRSAEEKAARLAAAREAERSCDVARKRCEGPYVPVYRCADGCGAGVRHRGGRCHRCMRAEKARAKRSHLCLARCGAELYGNQKLCSACRKVSPRARRTMHQRELEATGERRACSHPSGCDVMLNRNNRSGLCKRHLNLTQKRQRRLLAAGERPVCRYQADGMRCTQQLYRTTRNGLCQWHGGGRLGTYGRAHAPKMVLVAAESAAA